MSYKASLVKLAIKWTPKFLVLWVANIILKGIAELTYFAFDIDTRKPESVFPSAYTFPSGLNA
ncbi:hypothetical protein ABZN20_16000 [Methylococcus sp. ANG]|uniref:hypothetical protein n=1 Tax=Methylococcus sp. ANG TaxID=3231903 RepID=UPI003459D716